ncbi:hypothetical protein [Alkalihalobacterium elongatum]|uniref:hypothetical protein n=1 Tax=Alkalihalobacterium elongatum TaxID=2675466 RepID=UPI001C1F3F06|nr:hypothetical protein [Alkalihalobacterium elongatum]
MSKTLKIILITISFLIVSVFGVVAYSYYETAKYEEVWDFRGAMDEYFYPVRNEALYCVYSIGEDKGYSCIQEFILINQKESYEFLSNYETKRDDALLLQKYSLEGLVMVEEFINIFDRLNPGTPEFVKVSNELFAKREEIFENNDKINEVLGKYYTSSEE